MSKQEITVSAEQQARDAKRLKTFKFLYPFSEFCAGLQKAFFGTYLTFFYTNVFMFSVTFTASMSLISNVIGWVGTPLFAAFMDRFQFKKAKFWPWLLVGATLIYGIQTLITALPVLTGQTTTLASFVFALVIFSTIIGPMASTPISGSYPRMGKLPADRQYFAMAQKVGRDGGKTIFGYVVPAMLIAFSLGAEVDMQGYALTGVISGIVTIAGYWLFALVGLKGSYVEREAMAEGEAQKKAKVPLSVIFKVLFTNRPVLGMFLFMCLHKAYYFLYTSYAAYVFNYVFGNFALLGTFFTVFNLLAIIGVMFGPLWTKIFKDSKKCIVSCFMVHMVFLLAIALTFKTQPVIVFMVLFGCSSFFMGMLENWVMPLFAASSDYGAWVTGSRMDAFIMSIYTLSVRASMFITTIVGSTILNSIGYTEFVASGEAPTEKIISGIANLFTWAPFIIACVALACLVFIFNLNDKRIKAIQEDVKNGLTKANASFDFNSLK